MPRIGQIRPGQLNCDTLHKFACAHPLRVHDGSETPSTIRLKQASTIAEIRNQQYSIALLTYSAEDIGSCLLVSLTPFELAVGVNSSSMG
jgi:hypothetical protein